MALVQELVRIHGGTVSVESEVGRGTTFTVSIPAGKHHIPPDHLGVEPKVPSTAVSTNAFVEEALRWLPGAGDPLPDGAEFDAANSLAQADPASHARPRVLIVDDNADMRSYVRRLLATDYEVTTAVDGVEALQVAQETVPALILSDVMMPRLDGFGLLQAIRSDPALASIPVILLSARAGEEATLDGVRAGANDYLVKPFSARELLAR